MIFCVIDGANVRRYNDYKLLPNNYISVKDSEPAPIEDYGDFLICEDNLTDDEVLDLFISKIEKDEN